MRQILHSHLYSARIIRESWSILDINTSKSDVPTNLSAVCVLLLTKCVKSMAMSFHRNRASRDFLWITLSVIFGNFFAKIFNLCGRRRRGGGPPGGGARQGGLRAPAAAATAAQIENF